MHRVGALCALLVLAGVAAAVRQDDNDLKNRPIAKVVTLLKDMMKQLQKEGEEDEEAYEALGCWCETNDKGKTKAIADAEVRIRVLGSDIEKHAAGSAQLTEEIASLQAELAKNQGALDTATALRQKQLAEFTEEEKDMMASIASLDSAVTTLSKHNGGSALMQLTDSEAINIMATARTMLRKHMDLLGEVITPKMRRAVEAFSQQPGSYSALQQKSNKESAPQSGQIFGVLKQMKETFETNLAKSQEDETTNQQSYEDMKAAKESEIKADTDQSNRKSALLAETDEKHAQAKEDLEQTEATLAADRKYLANLKAHCANINAEYEERVKTRNMEIEANSKALTLLTSDDASDLFSKSLGLVQLGSQQHDTRREEITKKLLAAARAAHDPRLSTLVARMRLDAFGKVKESLQGMVDSLLKEKEDEIKHKDFCIDALNTNARTTELKKRDKADAEAKLADHLNAMQTLAKAIELDKEEIVNLRVQLKKLSEDREKANKEFQETVADQRATQKLLTAALGVLKGFYERPALVQSKKQPAGPPPPPGFKKRADSAASGGVMNMIQSVINDAKAMEKEALQAEAQAQQAYEDAVADTNAAVTAKQEDIITKTEFRAREEQGKVSQEATRDERIADIDQLMKENLDLHYSCDYMVKNFEIRMTARDEEVEALKQGLATFSGATFSSAFLQKH